MPSEKEFKVNEYITLKLEGFPAKTFIYIKEKKFLQCLSLFLNIPENEIVIFDKIDSIDEATEGYARYFSRFGVNQYSIRPEHEFWGHCSTLQAWAENKYDTHLISSNLAFPLLKKLFYLGDSIAREKFKGEIADRLESGYLPVIIFLAGEGYLEYFTDEDIDSLDLDDSIRYILPIVRDIKIKESDKEKNTLTNKIINGIEDNIFDIHNLLKILKYIFKYEEFNCFNSIIEFLAIQACNNTDIIDEMLSLIKNEDWEFIEYIEYTFFKNIDQEILSNKLINVLVQNNTLETLDLLLQVDFLNYLDDRRIIKLLENPELNFFYSIMILARDDIVNKSYDWYYDIFKKIGKISYDTLRDLIIKKLHDCEIWEFALIIDMELTEYLSDHDLNRLLEINDSYLIESLLKVTDDKNFYTDFDIYDRFIRRIKEQAYLPFKTKIIKIIEKGDKDGFISLVDNHLLELLEPEDLTLILSNTKNYFFERIVGLVKEKNNKHYNDWGYFILQKIALFSPISISKVIVNSFKQNSTEAISFITKTGLFSYLTINEDFNIAKEILVKIIQYLIKALSFPLSFFSSELNSMVGKYPYLCGILKEIGKSNENNLKLMKIEIRNTFRKYLRNSKILIELFHERFYEYFNKGELKRMLEDPESNFKINIINLINSKNYVPYCTFVSVVKFLIKIYNELGENYVIQFLNDSRISKPILEENLKFINNRRCSYEILDDIKIFLNLI